jgi:hypothetical protein
VRAFGCLVVGVAAAILTQAPAATAQECHKGCARRPSIEACVRCSVNSPEAKRMGYAESGIRRWCEQNQPACYRPKGKQ